MAQSKRWQTEEFHLPAVRRDSRTGKDSLAAHNRSQPTKIRLKATPCAEASTTEEPDAGKPHVRDCAGGAG